MSSALGDSLPGSGGESESKSLFEFRHVEALFLEIGVLPNHPSRVELGSTSAVGVASTHDRALFVDWTYSGHRCVILALWSLYFKSRF